MSSTIVNVLCLSGTKWTAPLSSSTPDPCPSGQAFAAQNIQVLTSAEINTVLTHETRISALESSISNAQTPIDYGVCASLFAFGVSTVIVFHLIGFVIRSITNLVR